MDSQSMAAQRIALADFIRAHRTRLTPAAAGLDGGARRRTPGLRREEVAQLSGISVTWYTWIEQARAVSMSPGVLSRLSETLRLSPAERAYMFELAGRHDPDSHSSAAPMDAPAALVAAIGGMAMPAYVLDRIWRARAWNGEAAALFVGWLDRPGDRNLLRYMFTSPHARALIQDWEVRARRLLAEFRLDYGKYWDDPEIAATVETLRRESALFAAFWDEQTVIGREGGTRSFIHPDLGAVCYEQITFNLSSRPEFKLVMLVDTAKKAV
jgi:transcriptional regulator with XRE-family HTH domain